MTEYRFGHLQITAMPEYETVFTAHEIAPILSCVLGFEVTYSSLSLLRHRECGPDVIASYGRMLYRWGPTLEWFRTCHRKVGQRRRAA